MPNADVIRSALGTYKQSSRRVRPLGRLWPNGEFSVGYAPLGEESTEGEEWSWTGGSKGLSQEELDVRLEYMEEWLEWQAVACSLPAKQALHIITLSNAHNSHKPAPRAKAGLKGLTGYGTKMIRSGCYLLEKRLGKDDCVMVTLTVPTLDKDARRRLALEWGKVTNRLVQYLSRELVKAGRTPAIIGCVEIQQARLEKYRQGYLHLHLVCPAHANTGGVWAVDVGRLKTWWTQQLERTIKCTLPNMPRVETALVKKSVEGYLGKYLSKGSGSELNEFIGDLGEDSVPGQWWFASAPMKQAIKAGTRAGENAGALLDALVMHLLELGDGGGFEYIRHVDCVIGGRPVTVGWVGRLSEDMTRDIQDMLALGRPACH